MKPVETHYIKPFSSEAVATGTSVTSNFIDCKQVFTSLAVHFKEVNANAVDGSILVENSMDGVNVDGGQTLDINSVDTLSQLIPTCGRYIRFTVTNNGATEVTVTVKGLLKSM